MASNDDILDSLPEAQAELDSAKTLKDAQAAALKMAFLFGRYAQAFETTPGSFNGSLGHAQDSLERVSERLFVARMEAEAEDFLKKMGGEDVIQKLAERIAPRITGGPAPRPKLYAIKGGKA